MANCYRVDCSKELKRLPPMQNHHVIIGDGVTAAEFATTHRCVAGDTITIIGPNVENLSRGVAYAKAPADAP